MKVYALVRRQGWASLVPLQLKQDVSPEIALYPWTVVHFIDTPDSPFYGDDFDTVTEPIVRSLILLVFNLH